MLNKCYCKNRLHKAKYQPTDSPNTWRKVGAQVTGFTASKSDPDMKAYRKKLEDAGKPFKVAIIAVARRLLVQINAMIREERFYDIRNA